MIERLLRAALPLIAGTLSLHAARAAGEEDILGPARTALAQAQAELRDAKPVQPADEKQRLHTVDLLLKTGAPREALALLAQLPDPGLDVQLLSAYALLADYDYSRARLLIESLGREHPQDPRVREVTLSWWALCNDLPRIDRALQDSRSAGTMTVADRFSEADLTLRLLDYDGARTQYLELLKLDLDERRRAQAERGAATALFGLQRYDEALQWLRQSLALQPLDANTVAAMADALLRLGRIDQSIDTLTFALQISPWNERAHRLLGSGYTKHNYTQLFAAFPDRFSNGDSAMQRSDLALQRRQIDRARKIYRGLAQAHPLWADVEVRLGSLEYGERNLGAAREHYARALTLCPEYGRAHEGFARVLEGLRLELDVHRAVDEAALTAATLPVIPDIERYVLNWRALSARHQKRLALSLQPWARYIPALLEGGATVYIKPLYQRLSEAPYQETLRDQRIDYDSRLWDDVRGQGGHHTVVPIEDIENRIGNGYDTAIHEVSHQVHAVLAPQWTRQIQTLYAQTMRRQAATGDAFLSQYAASSVWEYFAEGANSLHNPRRDRFDTREIVLERLQARDPALLALTRQIMEEADVAPSFAAALVDKGHDQLSRGKPARADAAYRAALRRAPGDENALAARLHVLAVMGGLRAARTLAAQAYTLHPDSGSIVGGRAEVSWLSGADPAAIVRDLEQARAAVRAEDQHLVDAWIGELLLNVGNADGARQAFTRVVEYQPDDPEAVAGLAATEALAGRWTGAWRWYEQGLRARSGSVDLRVTYARDLLHAHETDRAREQTGAALLLDPEDPDGLALQAWQLMLSGDFDKARPLAARAHELGPWSTLAILVSAAAERHAGNASGAARVSQSLTRRLRENAPPEYVYRSRRGQYQLVYTLSAIDRQLYARMTEQFPGPDAETKP